MSNPPLAAARFTPTQWSTPADKAKFVRDLQRFVSTGFRRSRFTRPLYRRLSNCFGHIAHYDLGGFYAEWFATRTDRMRWIEHVQRYRPIGDPAYTYSDAERALCDWLIARVQAWRQGQISDRDFVGDADAQAAFD